MIIGFILGTLLAIFIFCLMHFAFETRAIWCVFVTMIVILLVTFAFQASDINFCNEEIAAFNSTRDIYYSSLEDEKLTGMERVQIVQMANEANREITKQKVRVHAWWNVFIPNDIKVQYDNIVLIGIKH